MLDVHLSNTGEEFDELPHTAVVFVTEIGTLSYGEAVAAFERRDNNGRRLRDGSSIVYANGAYSGDDDIGHLMADFTEKDSSKMRYALLKHRTQSIKAPMDIDFKEGNMNEEINAILSKYDGARIARHKTKA